MEILRLNERLIRSSFSEKEYDKFLQFFQDIWLCDAVYKVFMARRAFNLNFAFMDIMDAQYKDEYSTENIISNTALLLCAEELVDYYKMTGSFPKIILADDLLVHGRGILKLIDNLESLIMEFLKNSKIRKVSRQTIHSKLLDAINIYVFAQNVDGILLDQRFILKTMTQLPSSELKALSQKISRALQQCGVANTSYVLSAELPWNFCQKEYGNGSRLDGSSLFQYRGNVLRYYYRSSDDRILETIRVYYSAKNNSLKHMATSLVIFGDVSYGKGNPDSFFNVLCRNVAEEIRQLIPYSRIADILSYEQLYLARPRAQMLSYLLSVLSYSNFLREKVSADPQFIYKSLLQSDYRKIASNFDRPQKIQFEIIQLFNLVSQSGNMQSCIFKELKNYVGELNIRQGFVEKTSDYQIGRLRIGGDCKTHLESETIHEIAEDIFYEVGMNTECDANKYTQTQMKFDPSKQSNDFIRLEQYLHIMKQYGVSEIPSIGCVLNLMDSGLLAMNLDLDQSQDAMQCILKAGELSTFVLPRRFSVLVPALSIVERGYFKKGSSKKAVVSGFIDYLQEHCYQQDGKDSEEDSELLCKLKRSKLSLLYMYVVGQSFQDWDVNLLTNEDRLSHGMDERGNFSVEKYVSWTSSEIKRIRYYNYCAKVFLRSSDA